MGEQCTCRYVITWRKTPPNILDWDVYFARDRSEAEQVVKNITARGVHQYGVYPIGERVADLSSEY
jgi:hypothetical protein